MFATTAEIGKAIRNVPDFPEPGIQFKDITPCSLMRGCSPAPSIC